MSILTRGRTTDGIYRGVPLAQKERLFIFRVSHPYHRVTVNGATWRYVACGRGEKALLFLPGAFMKADMWFNQILALEEDYCIIAPDACALQGVFDLDNVCSALLRSLDAEGVERATVIGLSAGGGVAQILLQTYPERVEHAVFSHCGILEYKTETERSTKRLLWLARLLPVFVIRRVLRRMTTGKTPRTSRWTAFHQAHMEEAILSVERTMVVRFFRSSLEARRRFIFEPQALESWPGSILLLSSKDDALARPQLEALQERYPKARTELLEEGGHHAFLFFPEAYTAALSRFLDTAVDQSQD